MSSISAITAAPVSFILLLFSISAVNVSQSEAAKTGAENNVIANTKIQLTYTLLSSLQHPQKISFRHKYQVRFLSASYQLTLSPLIVISLSTVLQARPSCLPLREVFSILPLPPALSRLYQVKISHRAKKVYRRHHQPYIFSQVFQMGLCHLQQTSELSLRLPDALNF